MNAPANLLSGVRVLDLSNVLAGPYCTYQLALLGAEVIKVEMPKGGDLARALGADADLNRAGLGASFLAQNAGKKSVAIDLKSDSGKAQFLDLVDTADVVVENFRPGVMERLGLGWDVLRARKPSLVYCAISGFGQTGPMRGQPAYDQIVQGMSGLMSVTGYADGDPLRVGYPVADTFGGMAAAFAITAALVRARSAGEGSTIDVSMLEATLSSMAWVISNLLIAGQTPQRMGNDNFTAAPSGAFRTADGMLNIAANKQEQFIAVMRVIGRETLANDPRFAEREDRKRNRAALTTEIEAVLQTRPSLEWERLFNEAGVPAGRVLSVPEALALDQVRGRALVNDLRIADRDIAVMGAPFLVDGVRPAADAPPPLLGEHNAALLGTEASA
ncbi:CoA transferase [Sphingomonas koreensis]|nr:CoA transferase [Sphingomonas koreensis]